MGIFQSHWANQICEPNWIRTNQVSHEESTMCLCIKVPILLPKDIINLIEDQLLVPLSAAEYSIIIGRLITKLIDYLRWLLWYLLYVSFIWMKCFFSCQKKKYRFSYKILFYRVRDILNKHTLWNHTNSLILN